MSEVPTFRVARRSDGWLAPAENGFGRGLYRFQIRLQYQLEGHVLLSMFFRRWLIGTLIGLWIYPTLKRMQRYEELTFSETLTYFNLLVEQYHFYPLAVAGLWHHLLEETPCTTPLQTSQETCRALYNLWRHPERKNHYNWIVSADGTLIPEEDVSI